MFTRFLHETRAVLLTGLLVTSTCVDFACVKREHQSHASAAQANDQQSAQSQTPPSRININTASAKDLESLPGIGKGLAGRIIDHREKYGPFQRSEHLIIIRGISDRRFRALRDLITVE